MTTTKKVTKKQPHALFWRLLREMDGYDPRYRQEIKEGLVHRWTEGKTTSLSEMWRKFPAQYSRMIDSLKPTGEKRQMDYEHRRDRSAKRAIAAICTYVDKMGYSFESREHKLRYVMGIACRAANCSNFNAIPDEKLTAIYSLYCKRNSVQIEGNPELDHPVGKN